MADDVFMSRKNSLTWQGLCSAIWGVYLLSRLLAPPSDNAFLDLILVVVATMLLVLLVFLINHRDRRREADMFIYLELPEGQVPYELINGTKVVIGVTLSMKGRAGGRSKAVMSMAKPDRGLRSRLYLLDLPIEEVHADAERLVDEALAMRSSMATLASIFGFDSDIPSHGNKLGWKALSRKVAERAAQLDAHVAARLEDLGLKRPRSKRKPGRS